jgi:hypothetical protein
MLPASMDSLLAKLSEQQVILEKQKNTLSPKQYERGQHQDDSSSGSVLLTPASEKNSFSKIQSGDEKGKDATTQLDVVEMVRLKKELDAAKDQIARQKIELDQNRVIKHTIDQVTSLSCGAEVKPKFDASSVHHATLNPAIRAGTMRQDNWSHNEDTRSEFSDVMSAAAFNTTQNIWSPPVRPTFTTGSSVHSNQQFQQPSSTWGQPGARPWNHRGAGPSLPSLAIPQQQHMQQRNYSGPMSPVSANDVRAFNDYNQFQGSSGLRRSNAQNTRNTSLFPLSRNNGWDMYTGNVGALDGVNVAMNPNAAFQSMGLYPASLQYQPRPIGTPLSPTAEEFRTSQASATPWNAAVGSTHHSFLWLC